MFNKSNSIPNYMIFCIFNVKSTLIDNPSIIRSAEILEELLYQWFLKLFFGFVITVDLVTIRIEDSTVIN